jgi:hypothetical protein
MDANTILSISAIVVSTAGAVFAAVNHKRVRSNCCGTKLEASLDVETTTPPTAEKNPTNTVVNV